MVGGAGAVGLLAGCIGDDGGDSPESTPTATPEDTPTPTPEDTPTPTPEDTPTPTPEDTPTQTPEDTPTPTPEDMSLEDVVANVNDTIETVNNAEENSISSLDEALENADPLDKFDPVEASTPEEAAQEAQRLRDQYDTLSIQMLQRTAEEINTVADMGIYQPDEIDGLEEARSQASTAEALNPDAAEAMWDAIDLVEYINEEITAAADSLENFEAE